MLAIDHVVVSVPDLESAARELERRHGLVSVAGGVHPALGTANRIIPFGRDYLELLTVVDPTAFARTGLPVPDGPQLWGWMARAADFDARAERLGLPVVPLERERQDGTTLSWRLAGMHVVASDPALPVLIDWDADQLDHPASTPVDRHQPVSGIAWVEVAGDPERVARWCGPDAALPVRVRPGAPALLAVGLAATDGRPDIELRAPLEL